MSDGEEDLVLWYDKPAGQWLEALPVGNGRLGGMLFGGVKVERLQVNEVSLSSGSPQDSDNPDALAALPEVRRLLWEGQYTEASALAIRRLICQGAGSKFAAAANVPFGCYQTMGDLTLTFDHRGAPADYRRTLDLATADLARPERFATVADGGDCLVMSGQLSDGCGGSAGMKYMARVKALAEGGSVGVEGNRLRVEGPAAGVSVSGAAFRVSRYWLTISCARS